MCTKMTNKVKHFSILRVIADIFEVEKVLKCIKNDTYNFSYNQIFIKQSQ